MTWIRSEVTFNLFFVFCLYPVFNLEQNKSVFYLLFFLFICPYKCAQREKAAAPTFSWLKKFFLRLMKSLVRKEKEENMDINTYILMNKYSIYFGDTWWGGGIPTQHGWCVKDVIWRGHHNLTRLKRDMWSQSSHPQTGWWLNSPSPFALFPSSHLPLHHTHTQWKKKHQSTKEINIFVFSNFLPFHYFEIPLKNK